MRPFKILFATSNPHKVRESKEVLKNFNIEIVHLDIVYPEIQSDSLTEIVSHSAKHVTNEYKKKVVVEDAGLFVEALNGFPGPYSSYVYRTIGLEGVLKVLVGMSNRRASFKSALAFCEAGGEPIIFTGETFGLIAKEKRGTHGFGFDPIFIPREGDGRTFAEMNTEKNEVSHRRRALEKFAKWIVERS